jgi:hypothetical protein
MKSILPGSSIEYYAQNIAIVLFLFWNLYYGALLRTPYPKVLVTLYEYPMWRVLLVFLVIASVYVSLPLSILVATAVFFYFMDMPHFLEPWK